MCHKWKEWEGDQKVSGKRIFGQIMSRIWPKDERNRSLVISHVFCRNTNGSSVQVRASVLNQGQERNYLRYLCEIDVH